MRKVHPTGAYTDQHQHAIGFFQFRLEYLKRDREPSADDYTQGHELDPGDSESEEVHRNNVQGFEWKIPLRFPVLHTIGQLN